MISNEPYIEQDLKSFLDEKVDQYNKPSFIKYDPISIPHLFTRKQDIEIMGWLIAFPFPVGISRTLYLVRCEKQHFAMVRGRKSGRAILVKRRRQKRKKSGLTSSRKKAA